MTPPDSQPPCFYRSEAQPFSPDKLFASQKEAFDWLLARIEAAITRAQRSPAPRRSPSVDDERQNQVLFVSGVRGSGKTSIPLSLQRTVEKSQEPKYSLLRQHAVWLETLDLDPWPKGSNPMVAILARIERAVRDLLGQDGSSPSHQGLLSESTTTEEAFNALGRLQTDLAISWDGSPAPQNAYTDADQYATDVRRAEDARLRLNRRFHEVLDLLSKALDRCREPGVLFILPIDDFDLNPEISFDVLRIVRRLSSPHFLAIVLGDLHIAENVFELVLNRQLREAGGLRPGDRHPLLEARVGSTSSAEIAANAIRKLLPPSQRFEIRNLTMQEALKFTPKGAAETLGSLLDKVKFTPRQPLRMAGIDIDNFYKFLVLFDRIKMKDDEVKYDSWQPRYRSAYEFLSAPARHVMDLWHMFNNFSQENKEAQRGQLARCLAEWTRMIVQEDANLSAEERTDILSSLRWDVVENEWDIRLQCIKLVTVRGEPLLLATQPASPLVDCDVSARLLWRWRFTSRRAHDPEDFNQPLSDRTASSIKLLHDYLRLTGTGRIEPDFEDDDIRDRAYAEWHVEGRPAVKIPWFLSIWPTFWEFSVFARIWNQFRLSAERIRSSQSTLEDTKLVQLLALGWIVAGSVTLTGRDVPDIFKRWFDPAQANTIDFEKDDWLEAASLTNAVCGEFASRAKSHQDDLRTATMSKWLINLALILSPESGVLFAGDWALDSFFWQDAKDSLVHQMTSLSRPIREHRARRLGEAALTEWGKAIFAQSHPLNASPFKPDQEIRTYLPQRYRDVQFPRAITDESKQKYFRLRSPKSPDKASKPRS